MATFNEQYEYPEDYFPWSGEGLKDDKNKMNTFDFLTSTRFWAMVIGALSIYLQSKGFIGEPEMMLIATITAGFTIVKTADKYGDKQIMAAGVNKGSIEASDVVKVPPQE